MSRSRNPFDSDDESNSPVKSYSKAAINPFDDEATFEPQAGVSRPQEPSNHKAANPFDDDDDDDDLKSSAVKASSQQKGCFDDAEGFASVNTSQQSVGRERGRNQFKARASASGDAALKKAQKLKDVGSSQASKFLDGGINQVHKMKESTHSAFKSSRNGSADLRDGHDNAQLMREELLKGASSAKANRVHYDDSQFQQQDLEYKSVDELEGYALQKSEETTETVQNCLRVAEDMKEDASRTLLNLHGQGEQIRKTHETAFDIDNDLGRAEKVLGTLGGMFSKTWKPSKSRPISGPALSKNESFKRRGHHLEQRIALGLNRSSSKGRTKRAPLATKKEQTTQDHLELEKNKQDDGLSALSDVLDELKIMSQDMSGEVESQSPALDDLFTDVGTLKDRVQGANYRARRILGR